MKFFDGGVSEAITERERDRRAFIVFVEGGDATSSRFRTILESESLIPEEEYVAVRVASPSREYDEFASIYRRVPVPSVFVIGEGGRPIAVASSELQRDQLLTVIGEALRARGSRCPPQDPVQLLLKLPTGGTTIVQFSETSTLKEVREYVRNSLRVKYTFYLTTPLPRRVFTTEDEEKTLTSLDLHPASTILVVSTGGPGLKLWALNLAVALAADFARCVRRAFRQVKQWITRFLVAP